MFGLNLFDIGRFTETTTILWLRVVGIVITAIGAYILYIARQQTPPSTILIVVGVLIVLLGVASILVYLLYGSQLATYTSSSCVYCPSTPVRVSLNGGLRGTLPGMVHLPAKDPFSHTALYYCLVEDIRPSGSSTSGDTVIRRDDLYELFVDSNTGELGLRILPDNSKSSPSSSPVYFGKMPLQTFCQIAVIQNEKETSVYVNGIPRGSIVRENLPPTSAVQSQYIFNPDGVVRTGIIYQIQIYEGSLTEEELMSANERMLIQYENDSTFQNTRTPTENSRLKMTMSETFLGYIRVLGGFFGYGSGVKLASSNTTTIRNATRDPTI